MNLSIAFCTGRAKPEQHWFLDSLSPQVRNTDKVEVILVDLFFDGLTRFKYKNLDVVQTEPKPNVWQGKHRLTKMDFWAKSSALNTAICLASHEWFSAVDDRCVVMDGYMDAIVSAYNFRHAVMGSYEKRTGMKVENGIIVEHGTVVGTDTRLKWGGGQVSTFGEAWFGCCNALPLEWCLECNGYDETCDGMRYEDTTFGRMVARNGHRTVFNPQMRVIQDRHSDFPSPNGNDKGISPNDKSHALLGKIGQSKKAIHRPNIRFIREMVQNGNPFPVPTEPTHDWFDGQPLSEMVNT